MRQRLFFSLFGVENIQLDSQGQSFQGQLFWTRDGGKFSIKTFFTKKLGFQWKTEVSALEDRNPQNFLKRGLKSLNRWFWTYYPWGTSLFRSLWGTSMAYIGVSASHNFFSLTTPLWCRQRYDPHIANREQTHPETGGSFSKVFQSLKMQRGPMWNFKIA